MITYYEIQRNICSKFDLTIEKMDEDQKALDVIKSNINQAQVMVYNYKMPWMLKEGYFTLKAKYNTGTLTATQDSATITGAGTTWLRDMAGQKIIITDGTDGDVVYRIKSYSSATGLTLETPYIHTGGATLAYAIYYDTYTMPVDFKEMSTIKNIDVITTYRNDDTLMLSSNIASNNPAELMILGVRITPYYNTGTVSVTNGSTAVTGSGTSFDSTMAGRYIQAGTNGRLYKISSVTDSTNIVLEENYGGVAESGVNFQIDPPGLVQVRFHGSPSVRQIIPYNYWPMAIRLVNNNDISPIPSDVVLEFGALWLHSKNESSANMDFRFAKKDFDDEIAKLSMRQIDDTQQSGFSPVYN